MIRSKTLLVPMLVLSHILWAANPTDQRALPQTLENAMDHALAQLTSLDPLTSFVANNAVPINSGPTAAQVFCIGAASTATAYFAYQAYTSTLDTLPVITRAFGSQTKTPLLALLLPALKTVVTPLMGAGIGIGALWYVKRTILQSAQEQHTQQLQAQLAQFSHMLSEHTSKTARLFTETKEQLNAVESQLAASKAQNANIEKVALNAFEKATDIAKAVATLGQKLGAASDVLHRSAQKFASKEQLEKLKQQIAEELARKKDKVGMMKKIFG